MQHLLSGDALPKKCYRFHIVYYIKNDVQPVVTGVNYLASTMLEAITQFNSDYPDYAEENILYIIKHEN